MQKGFIFSHNKCVNCGACGAGCILENDWSVRPRNVYTYNTEADPALALTSLSLACNHCETPVCLEGCPSASYTREPITGAIVINDEKCLGCKYCQWNCPYDAPKFDTRKRVIGKCNLCYKQLIGGGYPACVNACPTGALGYGEINQSFSENVPLWFPDKKIYPKIAFTSDLDDILKIIPERKTDAGFAQVLQIEKGITGEWSLVAFSFLTTISVTLIISSLIKGIFPGAFLFISMMIMAGIFSFFHLERKLRVWRAVTNLKSSPLSREIALFIIFFVISLLSVYFRRPDFLVAASLSGLLLLIAIDSVYIFADRRKSVVFHSGQTFLSALLIVSFLTGYVLPFIFIALIKLYSSAYLISINKTYGISTGIRFLRIAILIVSSLSLILKFSYDPFIFYLFLSGEFLDRVIFYIDFEPMNINRLIVNNTNALRDEKKRG